MTEATPESKPLFKIETEEDLFNMITIARGGDPKAIQAVAEFMNFKSKTERSFFPDRITALAVAQLNGFGKVIYPDKADNPFSIVAEAIAEGYMGYKGFKSNQFVDMTRNTPDLSELKAASDREESIGWLAKLRGKGGSE